MNVPDIRACRFVASIQEIVLLSCILQGLCLDFLKKNV